jgi:hypothetical protein
MTELDAAYYENLRVRTLDVLTRIGAQLPEYTVGLVRRLIDGGEPGVALEIMSEMFAEQRGRLPRDTFELICDLAKTMQLDDMNVERLRDLVPVEDRDG